MKLSLPWPQNSVEALSSLSCVLLHVIKTGLLTSMHEMSAYKCKNRPSGSNQSCVACLAKHHLPRTRPHRGETQSRCLLFGNRGTVSSYTPDWLPQEKHGQLHWGQRSNPSCMDLDFWGKFIEIIWRAFKKIVQKKKQQHSPRKRERQRAVRTQALGLKGYFTYLLCKYRMFKA